MASLLISSWLLIQFILAEEPPFEAPCYLHGCLQKVLVLLTRALRVFVGNGVVTPASSLCQQLPNKLPTKSFYKIRRNSLSFSGNELKKTSPKKNFLSELSLLVWGRETSAWMFWLEAWKFIAAAVYCKCNFLGVCCVLKTAPSWFCSKCVERHPLCFVIVLASASHHLKII